MGRVGGPRRVEAQIDRIVGAVHEDAAVALHQAMPKDDRPKANRDSDERGACSQIGP